MRAISQCTPNSLISISVRQLFHNSIVARKEFPKGGKKQIFEKYFVKMIRKCPKRSGAKERSLSKDLSPFIPLPVRWKMRVTQCRTRSQLFTVYTEMNVHSRKLELWTSHSSPFLRVLARRRRHFSRNNENPQEVVNPRREREINHRDQKTM